MAGSCRFAVDQAGSTALELAGDSKEVKAAFLSGIDYWERRRHTGHAWAMKAVVWTLLLSRGRHAACSRGNSPVNTPPRLAGRDPRSRPPTPTPTLPLLPEEIWLVVCSFLRSADFVPPPAPVSASVTHGVTMLSVAPQPPVLPNPNAVAMGAWF